MKLIFIFSLIFAFNLFSGELKPKHEIQEILLYSDSAYIKRTGEINLNSKDPIIVLENLPARLNDKSVSFGFSKSNNSIKIKSIKIETIINPAYQNEIAKNTQIKYEELIDRIDRKNKEFATTLQHSKILKDLNPTKKDIVMGVSSNIIINPVAWTNFQNMISKSLNDNLELEQRLLQELDDLNEELMVTETKLDFYKKAEQIESKTVKIEYSINTDSKIGFYLTYYVKDAYWFPRYSVKVEPTKKVNQLSFYALVKNNTGEDWKNVSLAFSAADNSDPMDIPVLNEWRIGYMEDEKERERPSPKPQGKIQKREDNYREEKQQRESYPVPAPATTNAPAGGAYNYDKKKIQLEPQQQQMQKMVDDNIVQEKNIRKTSKDYFISNNIVSKSQETEDRLKGVRSEVDTQRIYFQQNNYNSVIEYGKRAKQKLNLINEKYKSELEFAEKEVDSLNKKAAILQANTKLSGNLVSPRTSSGGFDYRYISLNKETILSDNSFNKILIQSKEMSAQIEYVTSPLSQKSVFITSTSISDNNEPYLEGPLDLLVKEDFIGTSKLYMTSSGENIKMDLGVDNNVEVKRREVKFSEKKGIISKDNSVKHLVEITIKNNKKESITLKLIDRIPYTNDNDVKIKMLTQLEGAIISDTGILTYVMQVPKDTEMKVSFEYAVINPSKNKLIERTGGEE